MKPLQGDQQLRSLSRSYAVAFQALKPNSSPRRRVLDALNFGLSLVLLFLLCGFVGLETGKWFAGGWI